MKIEIVWSSGKCLGPPCMCLKWRYILLFSHTHTRNHGLVRIARTKQIGRENLISTRKSFARLCLWRMLAHRKTALALTSQNTSTVFTSQNARVNFNCHSYGSESVGKKGMRSRPLFGGIFCGFLRDKFSLLFNTRKCSAEFWIRNTTKKQTEWREQECEWMKNYIFFCSAIIFE